ncbi:MAG: hypothetical protein ACLP7P_09610 [Rhodomicrobium sp.]
MDTVSEPAQRKAFLSRVVEQFRELADEIGAPYRVEVWGGDNAADAGLRVVGEWEGEKREVLQVVARFVDGGDAPKAKLILSWQASEGEVTKLIGLGWTEGKPDAITGLDSSADRVDKDSAYAMGNVTHALRADVLRALKAQPGFVARAPVPRPRSEAVPVSDASFDDGERDARGRREPAARRAADKAAMPRPQPDIKLLQSTLGVLATKGGVRAEDVFAPFLAVAAGADALKQGDAESHVQGALVRLASFYDMVLSNSDLRPGDLGMEDGPLRGMGFKDEAVRFMQDEAVRWQVARDMVTGICSYYARALASQGVPETDVKEMLRSAFGRAASIANGAIAIFVEPEPAKGGGLWRFLRGKGLD